MAFVADFEVGGQEGCGEFVLDGVLHVLFFWGLMGDWEGAFFCSLMCGVLDLFSIGVVIVELLGALSCLSEV